MFFWRVFFFLLVGFFGWLEGRVCGINLIIFGIVLIGWIFLYRIFLKKDFWVKFILYIFFFCFILFFLYCFCSYVIVELGRFVVEFLILFMGICVVMGLFGSVGYGNLGNVFLEWFIYIFDLEEDLVSFGCSRSILLVN